MLFSTHQPRRSRRPGRAIAVDVAMSMPKPLARKYGTATDAPDDVDFSGRSRAELDFWINCIGAPLLIVEKQELVARGANRNAADLFGTDISAFERCPLDRLVGKEAACMLGQIWSTAPVGVPGEPFILRSIVREQERLLIVQVSQLLVEGELLRLFTFTDAPPQGSVALAGWQENIIELLNWLPFGFEIASTEDQVQFVNSQFHALFGYSPHELEDVEDWWSLAYPDPEYRRFARKQWESSIAIARAENREMTPFDLDVTIKDGSRRTIQFRHRTIGNFNTNLYLDVTREREYARELKALADTDSLTGAVNRRRFFEQAEQFYADAGHHSPPGFAILMLDIDNFKRINDLHGHGIGDLVLQEFTRRCGNAIREDDLLARLGGEEFAVMLGRAGAGKARAGEIGERIRAEISALPFEVGGARVTVTVSVGGAVRVSGEGVEETISRADKALYAAKHAGRDRVVIESGVRTTG
jgi:diguanylate cyclase (GGDEF)-like protein